MKIHFFPVSTSSRPVLLFCAEANVSYEPVVVDLMSGAQLKEPFLSKNPNGLVPVLEDGDFVLTESSAIVKYLADKVDSPLYPKDLKKRARVNERMDWFNTTFGREFCYHLAYPQLFPHHARKPEAAQNATIEWGKERVEKALQILDTKYLAGNKYLCGDELTIADLFGAEILATGDLIGVNYKRFPNVDRWMKSMRERPSWRKVNEATDGFAATLKEKPFVSIA
jgi:glutathione S-transferase